MEGEPGSVGEGLTLYWEGYIVTVLGHLSRVG